MKRARRKKRIIRKIYKILALFYIPKLFLGLLNNNFTNLIKYLQYLNELLDNLIHLKLIVIKSPFYYFLNISDLFEILISKTKL